MKLNKKNILSVIAIFILIAIIVIIVVVGSSKKEVQADYEKEILDIGSKYFTDELYSLIDNPVTALQELEETGLLLDFTTLNSYQEFSDNTKKILNDAKCDYDTSRVIIYPESPFKVNSFTTELFLDCENSI